MSGGDVVFENAPYLQLGGRREIQSEDVRKLTTRLTYRAAEEACQFHHSMIGGVPVKRMVGGHDRKMRRRSVENEQEAEVFGNHWPGRLRVVADAPARFPSTAASRRPGRPMRYWHAPAQPVTADRMTALPAGLLLVIFTRLRFQARVVATHVCWRWGYAALLLIYFGKRRLQVQFACGTAAHSSRSVSYSKARQSCTAEYFVLIGSDEFSESEHRC